jgi:hypothetical protein
MEYHDANRRGRLLGRGARWTGHGFYEDWERVLHKAPNLTLNITNTIPEPWKVVFWTGLSLLVQLIVMAFNAIAVYYLKWLRARSVVAAYGYPVWAIGTLCISLGVSICARVIESSTRKYTLEPGTRTHKSLRIARLQLKIASDDFPAFAFLQPDDDPRVRISIRDGKMDAQKATKLLLILSRVIVACSVNFCGQRITFERVRSWWIPIELGPCPC